MPKPSLRLIHCLLWALICCGACSIVQAQTYKYSILYAFKNNGTDPTYLVAPLILDSAGNLYGTSVWGGDSNLGTVFKISKTGQPTVPIFKLTPAWKRDGSLQFRRQPGLARK